jgi:tight adherence protein C
VFASLAAILVIAAVGARERPVLHGVLAAADGAADPLERIGGSRIVRAVVSARRLETAAGTAGAAVDVSALGGRAAVAAVGVLLASFVVGGPLALLSPLIGVVVLRAPSFLIGRAAKRRARAIERDVPLLLDVLSLASFAGLPAPAALGRAVSVMDGPLADELRSALRDVELGARWRDRLGELAGRLETPDFHRTITVLRRSESIGSSTVEPISLLADEVRASRRASATERARKAPVQMLFPLVFLVLPAFLLLTVVPVLLSTVHSIR